MRYEEEHLLAMEEAIVGNNSETVQPPPTPQPQQETQQPTEVNIPINTIDLANIGGPIGTPVNGYLLIKSQQIKQNKTGKDYLRIELTDGKNSLNGNIWNTSKTIGTNAVKVVTKIGEFASNRCFDTITSIEPINIDLNQIDTGVDVEYYTDELAKLYQSIEDEEYKQLVYLMMFKDGGASPIFTTAAALGHHHAYRHGLLVHTVEVVKASLALAEIYGDKINKDLLIAGAMLHDIGKTKVYVQEGFEISYDEDEGMREHIYIACRDIEIVAHQIGLSRNKTDLLINIIASHHSKLEWGAISLPNTIESMIVSSVDGVTSMIAKIMEAEEVGEDIVKVRYEPSFKNAYTPTRVKKMLEDITHLKSGD